jgi:hypothetical protein
VVVLKTTTFSVRVSVKDKVVGTLSVAVKFWTTVEVSSTVIGMLIVVDLISVIVWMADTILKSLSIHSEVGHLLFGLSDRYRCGDQKCGVEETKR